MRYFQRICVELDDFSVRVVTHGSDQECVETHEKLFPLFFQQVSLPFFKKSQTPINFQSIFAENTIIDRSTFEKYLRFILLYAKVGTKPFQRVEAMIVLPTLTSSATKETWLRVCEEIGINRTVFCSRALAAAVGAGFTFPLPVFGLVLHLGWSSSEWSGVTFDRCVYAHDIPLCARSLIKTLQAESWSRFSVECSEGFWSALVRQVGVFLSHDSQAMERSYAQLWTGETEKFPLEYVVEHVRRSFQESVALLKMHIQELSADQLAIAAQQGIVLTGNWIEDGQVAKALAAQIHLPVYLAADPQAAASRGGLIIFQTIAISE